MCKVRKYYIRCVCQLDFGTRIDEFNIMMIGESSSRKAVLQKTNTILGEYAEWHFVFFPKRTQWNENALI